MLSEEEKKAIKYFYNLRSTIDESYMLFDEEINVKCGKDMIKQISLVLNLIAKLQKENEELKQENKRIKYFSSNLFIDDYIPKKVVKDKIKEIEEDKECYYYDWFLEERDIEKTINILEKILGDE